MVKNLINMEPEEIQSKLILLIINAFPGSTFRDEYVMFSITFDLDKASDRFGEYNMLTHNIRICGMSPNPVDNWKTLIHELSHHVDFCNRGYSDHDKPFFDIYEKMLDAAVYLDYFSSAMLATATEGSADHNFLQKTLL